MRRSEDLPVRRNANVPVVYTPDIADRYEPEEVDLRGHVAVLYRRRRLIVAVMAAVFIVGMLYTLTRRPVYESVAKILVFTDKPAVASSDADLPAIRNLDAITGSRSIDTQIEVISSPDLLDNAFRRLDPGTQLSGFRGDQIPDWACKISQEKDADVIAITGRAYTPEAAAALAKAIVAEYLSQDLRQSNQAVHQARVFAQQKMTEAAGQLSVANRALSTFKSESGLFAPETQVNKQAEHMAELAADIDATRSEIASRHQENAALMRSISEEQKNVLTNTTVTMNPQFTAAMDRIDKLQSDRTALLQEYTPGSREVKEIETRISLEEGRLKQIAATVVGSQISARNPIRDTLLTQYSGGVAGLAAANARLRSLQSEWQSRMKTAQKMPESERQLAERLQRVSTLQRTFDMLSTRYHTLLLSEQSALPSGILSSTPRVASSPAYPHPAGNAVMFLLVGALLAFGVTMVAERLDLRVHDPSLVEQMSGVTALSMVPDMPRESPDLSNGGAEKPILLESFRILRNNISFTGFDHGMKVLAVTSPGRGEGKSTTAVNLAITTAMDGNRVLLVDADLHHPSLHKSLNISGDVGLSNVLRGHKSLKKAIHMTAMPHIDCLPAGPPILNAVELLKSESARDVFNQLREMYDTVLIDCPPAAGLSDAQVIAKLADGILLVVSMSRTLKSQLDAAIRLLGYTGVPLVGVVMNRVDINPKTYGYYYGGYEGSELLR